MSRDEKKKVGHDQVAEPLPVLQVFCVEDIALRFDPFHQLVVLPYPLGTWLARQQSFRTASRVVR